MIDPTSEARLDDVEAQHSPAVRERTFRVLTTGEVRDSHSSLLRNLASHVAVEEVADIGAVLTRLGEEPLPHLVVLAWSGSTEEDIGTLRRLHDHTAAVPLFIIQELHRPPSPQDAADETGVVRLDVVRDAVVRLVASIESLVVGAPTTLSQSAPTLAPEAEQRANPLDLRLDECRATWHGMHVELSLTEFRVVARLASGAGSEISHRDLYDVIKSQGFVAGTGDLGYRGSVRATIKRIRQKFRQVDSGFAAIRTYPGFGYRWVTESTSPAGPETTTSQQRLCAD